MNKFNLISTLFSVLFLSTFVLSQDTTLSVTSDGNVGIGTTSPIEKLVVGDDFGIKLSGTRITIGNANGASALNLGTNFDNRAFLFWHSINNHLAIGTNSGGNLFGQTLVLKDGFVGSGTAEPTEKLDIRGNIAVSGKVDGVDISSLKSDFDKHLSSYKQFEITPDGYSLVTKSFLPLKLKEQFSFTKIHNDSKIEVYVNAWADLAQFNDNVNRAQITVRIDNIILPEFRTVGQLIPFSFITTTYVLEPISILAVFEELPAGAHEINLWARVVPVYPNNAAYGKMTVFGEGIIVKETW